MKTYKDADRPDPRIREERVESAFDIFQQTKETGQGQIIFMTGDLGSGHQETLRAIDKRLGRELGAKHHSERVIRVNFENRRLYPWSDIDLSPYLGVAGALFPLLTWMMEDTPFSDSFVTLTSALLNASAIALTMAEKKAALNARKPESKISLEEAFDPTILSNLLSAASLDGEHPLVFLIDGFDQALDTAWYDWLLWHGSQLVQNHPLLLIVTLDQGPAYLPPSPTSDEDSNTEEFEGLLRAAQYLCHASEKRPASGQWWHLDRMTQDEVAQWMGKGDLTLSQQLYDMTGGDPILVAELWQAWTQSQGHWTSPTYNQEWAVETDETGYWWRIRPGLDPGQLPGAQQIMMQRLRQAWEAVDTSVESDELLDLMRLLSVAAQEGQTFSPPALAQVCEQELDDLYDFLDEVFAISDQPNSLLIQEPATIIHDPERDGEVAIFCYTFRSEFVWHTLRHAYWSGDANLKADKARLHQLASALDALYHPQQQEIAHTLIRLYNASGDKKRASHHQNVSDTIAHKISLRSFAMIQLQQDRQPWDGTGWYLAMCLWFEAGDEMRDYFPHQETLTVCQAAYDAACHLDIRSSEGRGLHGIAAALRSMGRSRDALAYFEKALSIREIIKDRYGKANTLNSMGVASSSLGENEKALGYYEEALPIRRAVGDRAGEAATLTGMGFVYSSLGENEKALGYYEEALPIQRAVGDRAGEAATLTGMGFVYSSLGEKEKALGYYEEALPIRRAVGDRAGEAATLTNMGSVYSSLGKKEKALGYFEDALPIRRAMDDRTGEAATLTDIGVVYSDLGEKEKALRYYEDALSIRRAVGDRSGEAVTIIQTGHIYVSLDEKEKALSYYQEALPILKTVGDRAGAATTLTSIGVIHSYQDDQEQALLYYAQALQLQRDVGHRQAEAITLHNMAKSYSSMGDQDKALVYYQEALQHQQAIGDRWHECIVSASVSRLHLEEQEWAEAENYARQAVEIAQAVKHPDLARYEALLAEIEAGEVDDHEADEDVDSDGQGGFFKRMWRRLNG